MEIVHFVIAGIASYFHPEDFTPAIRTTSPYVCAMDVVKPGTQVEVENVENGKSSHCIVTGSGPGYGRVLDASPKVAAELGFLSAGLARVRVYRIAGHMSPCHFTPESQACDPSACVLPLPKPAILSC